MDHLSAAGLGPPICHESGPSRSALSSHLAKLEETGCVEIEKTARGKFRLTILRLTRAGRAAFAGHRKTTSSLLAEAGGRR